MTADMSVKAPLIKERNSVDVLNLLRVLATLFVFLLHGRSDTVGIDDGFWLFSMLTNMPAWAGVWILFFLSGYLMQKGFLKNRYPIFEGGKLKSKALFEFYLRRFLKIAPAYYIYLLLFVVIRPDNYFFSSPLTALRIFTFTFNGIGGISGIGHLWYVSLAMWFYVFAPFFYYIISKLKTNRSVIVAFCLTVVLGFGLRNALWFTDLPWYEYVYTFIPCNIDLFFGGMLACTIADNIGKRLEREPRAVAKLLASIAFAALVVFNCFVYWKEIYRIYQYVLPTFYILGCSCLLWVFDCGKVKHTRPDRAAVLKNPLRLIDLFSPVTYSFYIFHMAVFYYVLEVLVLWEGFGELSMYLRYTIYMTACFVMSLLLGILFTKMTACFSKPKKKTA